MSSDNEASMAKAEDVTSRKVEVKQTAEDSLQESFDLRCVCVCVCVCVGSVLLLGVAVIFIIRGMPPFLFSPRSTPPSTGYS